MDNDKKDKIQQAKRRRVLAVASQLPKYFNSNNRCIVSNWDDLVRKLGLSLAELPELKALVKEKGYILKQLWFSVFAF